MQAHDYINMLFIYSAGDSIFEGVKMMRVVSCHVTLFLTRKKLVIIGGFLWDHKQCCMAHLTEPRYLAWFCFNPRSNSHTHSKGSQSTMHLTFCLWHGAKTNQLVNPRCTIMIIISSTFCWIFHEMRLSLLIIWGLFQLGVKQEKILLKPIFKQESVTFMPPNKEVKINNIKPFPAKAYLMVSNSLTLESWKVRSLRLELESLTNSRAFFTFKVKIGYIYILIPSHHCFQANFQEFHMFYSRNWWNYCYFWAWKAEIR